jgi:acetylornithine deacetylase
VPLTGVERSVVEAVAERRDDLVALATELIGFDTTAGDDPRELAVLQEHLRDRLAAAGAATDLWEPDDDTVAGSRQVPAGFSFRGRPQLAARFGGSAGGPSLLFNGHVDVVSAEPVSAWSTADPFRAEQRDGRLIGRGACDMKGGVAAMAIAAETVAGAVALRGPLTVCTVTDEEGTGAGAIAAVARGVRADAGLVAEPTSFDVWTAVRGDVIPTITVEGRLGHAGVEHPDWREGGAVNAIDKARLVMDELAAMHDEWQTRADHRHPRLSPGHAIPVKIEAGDWAVNVPARCSVTYHVAYLPGHADADGWGTRVEAELTERVARAAARDPWLAEHPPRIAWSVDIPPAEVGDSEPVVGLALSAGAELGLGGRRIGFDSWHDGATFTRFGATPAVAYGPPAVAGAHTVDESVAIDDLVATAQAYALAALRHCGHDPHGAR